jgi:integrase
MARTHKWIGGYRDRASGIYYIRRDIAGRSYKVSTRCKTLDGAKAELERFEKDPQNYVPGGSSGPEGHFFTDVVHDYLQYSKHSKGNSEQHVASQAASFASWAVFLERRGLTVLEQITPALVDDYCAWRRQGGATEKDGQPGRVVGPHSVAIDVAAIKAMMTWATRGGAGILPDNPLRNYPIPKRPKNSSKPRIITMEEWAKVREHLSDTWQLAGDALLGSSMRYSSLARLAPTDVDCQRNVIHLGGNKIKGKVGVDLPVSHVVAVAARTVAMARIPKTATSFDKMLARACGEAGVQRFTVHCFRHSAAMWALEDGLTMKQLQQRLGHANVHTTEIYTNHLIGHGDYRGRV